MPGRETNGPLMLTPKPVPQSYEVVETYLVDPGKRWITDVVVSICRRDLHLLAVEIEWFRPGFSAARTQRSFTTSVPIKGMACGWTTIRLCKNLAAIDLTDTAAHECRHLWQRQHGFNLDASGEAIEADARRYEQQARSALKDYLAIHRSMFYQGRCGLFETGL